MLNKELFKKEIKETYEFLGQTIPKVNIVKKMYEECIYLTDEEFKKAMKNLIGTYEKVTLPNILKSLPKYTTVKDGKKIDPPRNIEEYCEKYLWESYKKDKYEEYLKTLVPPERKILKEIQEKFNHNYEIPKEYLIKLHKMNLDDLAKEYKENEYKYRGVVDFIECILGIERPKTLRFGVTY